MNDTETSTVFAGIDGRTDATLPTWYEREHEPEEVDGDKSVTAGEVRYPLGE